MTLHLCFLVEERRGEPGVGPVFTEVFEHLQGRGFNVDILIPEQTAWRADMLAPSHDLYLLKSDTELALTVAGILQAHEAPILNPYPNCLAAKDKIATARRLRAGRIPTPRSWAAADLGCLRPVIEEIPLIIRPYRGFHGCGAQKVADPHELATMPRFNAPVLAQEYIAGTGDDVKLYVVGDRVFSTRKPFSARSFTIPGRSCPVSAEMRDVALRCGEVFGLGLYGLDVIETREGPYVVDLNYFPGYKGVPGASRAPADYIADYAQGRVWLPGAGPIEPIEAAEYAEVPEPATRNDARPAMIAAAVDSGPLSLAAAPQQVSATAVGHG
jgi:ribosomal protein S6--L-glutamate ligase